MVSYTDSIPRYSIETATNNKQHIYLLFLKQFRDSLEIYLNNDKVESFYKDDFHYDDKGNEFIIHDETPKIEVKLIVLKRKSKNTITIVSRNSKKKVSFDIKDTYTNYFISYHNGHWYFTGTKSKTKDSQ